MKRKTLRFGMLFAVILVVIGGVRQSVHRAHWQTELDKKLWNAAEHGDSKTGMRCLELGANPNGLYRSRSSGWERLLDSLHISYHRGETGEYCTPLAIYVQNFCQAEDSKVEFVIDLVKHGANPNVYEPELSKPVLYTMVIHDNIELVRTMLEHGADTELHTGNLDESTPLMAFELSPDMAELLIAHGANVNNFDHYHSSPLYLAAQRNDEECARIFIDHGADVNAHDQWGTSILEVARKEGAKNIVRLLLKNGAKEVAHGSHRSERSE